jgi:hypothetical protein
MRRLLLLSAAIVIAACSDNQQPTAPANRPSVSAKGLAAGQLALSPQAKPVDQVGFTNVQLVAGAIVEMAANTFAEGAAECPQGTTGVGGYYDVVSITGQPPYAWRTVRSTVGTPTGPVTGWRVHFANNLPGSGLVKMQVIAICIS